MLSCKVCTLQTLSEVGLNFKRGWIGSNFEQSWMEVGTKLARTSSEVGLNLSEVEPVLLRIQSVTYRCTCCFASGEESRRSERVMATISEYKQLGGRFSLGLWAQDAYNHQNSSRGISYQPQDKVILEEVH